MSNAPRCCFAAARASAATTSAAEWRCWGSGASSAAAPPPPKKRLLVDRLVGDQFFSFAALWLEKRCESTGSARFGSENVREQFPLHRPQSVHELYAKCFEGQWWVSADRSIVSIRTTGRRSTDSICTICRLVPSGFVVAGFSTAD